MRRLSAFTVALACLSQAAAAAITGRDTLFTSVCIDSQVLGFDWQNGAWGPGMFYPNKYTLQKRDPKTPDCATVLSEADPTDDLFSNVAYGCYTITDFGNGPGAPLACSEVWDAGADQTETLTSVTCAAIASFEWIIFNPTGNFQYTRLGGNLTDNPIGGVKDPITASIGKCNLGRPPGLYPPPG